MAHSHVWVGAWLPQAVLAAPRAEPPCVDPLAAPAEGEVEQEEGRRRGTRPKVIKAVRRRWDRRAEPRSI